MLFKMKIANSSCCSYCKIQDETIKHLFYECRIIKQLWENIKNAFIHLPLPDLTPRSAHLGFHLLQDSLVNHIHLIFKIAVYNQRNAGFCSLNYIKSKIKAIKEIEQNITYLNPNAKLLNAQKWARMAVLPPEN